jgi:hypothetical protein
MWFFIGVLFIISIFPFIWGIVDPDPNDLPSPQKLRSTLLKEAILQNALTGNRLREILCAETPQPSQTLEEYSALMSLNNKNIIRNKFETRKFSYRHHNYIHQARGSNRIYTLNLCKTPSPYIPSLCDHDLCSKGGGTGWITHPLGELHNAKITSLGAFETLLFRRPHVPSITTPQHGNGFIGGLDLSKSTKALRLTMKNTILGGRPIIIYVDVYCSRREYFVPDDLDHSHPDDACPECDDKNKDEKKNAEKTMNDESKVRFNGVPVVNSTIAPHFTRVVSPMEFIMLDMLAESTDMVKNSSYYDPKRLDEISGVHFWIDNNPQGITNTTYTSTKMKIDYTDKMLTSFHGKSEKFGKTYKKSYHFMNPMAAENKSCFKFNNLDNDLMMNMTDVKKPPSPDELFTFFNRRDNAVIRRVSEPDCPHEMRIVHESSNFYHFQIGLLELC